MTKTNTINHSIYSLTKRIIELSEINNLDIDEIKETIRKEMGNFYYSSHLCFSIEESIDLINLKLEKENEDKYSNE